MRFTGTGYDSDTDSATADPIPPITLCSSAVSIRPVSRAALSKVPWSTGFTENMSRTRHEICLSRRSESAASSAMSTAMPQAAIVQSEPSRSVTARPGSNAPPCPSASSGAMPGSAPAPDRVDSVSSSYMSGVFERAILM